MNYRASFGGEYIRGEAALGAADMHAFQVVESFGSPAFQLNVAAPDGRQRTGEAQAGTDFRPAILPGMARFLISFDDGSMDHIPESDMPAVGEAAHAVVREAKAAGVWIFGGGLRRQQATIVATDGTASPGPVPETKAVVGGFSIIEAPTLDEALTWAARFASSCRCAQEVREIMFDPES